jgi:hypothetical protein
MDLRVRVNEELTLDCGVAERDARGGWRLSPPARTQFEQLLDYLERKPDATRGRRTVSDVETLAATALCLRWGTYLAVVGDATRPAWALAGEAGVAIVTEAELARIRVEAADAFERWLEVYRSDRACTRAIRLAIRAVAYLPGHAPIARPGGASVFRTPPRSAAAPSLDDDLRAAIERAPTRALAERLAAETCDAEPVATLADGVVFPLPLDECRFAAGQSRSLYARVNGRLKDAMWTCSWLAHESNHRRPWAERVLPFVDVAPACAPMRAPAVTLPQ